MLNDLVQKTKWVTPIVAGSLLATSTPVYAQEYPVFNGTPNPKVMKQWVADPTVITKTPIEEPTLQRRIEYTIDAENQNGVLNIHVNKSLYGDHYQDFLIVGTVEQNLYRPKAPVAGFTLSGLALTSVGVGVVGLLGAAVASAGSGGSYPCGDVDGDGNEDHCYRDNSSTVGMLAATGLGGLAVGLGSAYLLVKIKPFDLVKTKKHRTVEVERKTQSFIVDSVLAKTKQASDVPLEVQTSYFTVDSEIWSTLKTNNNGEASIQLSPVNPNFTFTIEDIANTDAAQQIQQAGFPEARYLPLLQEASVPISYDVTIKTKAQDGKNVEITIPVDGYEVSQKALEQVIMGL